jgi:uncharacterized protein YwqG
MNLAYITAMKFFDFFRRKKESTAAEGAGAVLSNGVAISSRLAAYLPQLEAAALPSVHIKAEPSDTLFLFDSKFGGYPYWPKVRPYPVDGDGNYLYLLAQLNFSQIPHLEGYPEKGLLQFYVAADDLYGLDFDDPTAQKNFRVIYFEDATEPPLENFHFLDEQQRESAFPVYLQMKLTFSLQKDYYSFGDIRYPEDLGDALMYEEKQGKGKASLYEEVSTVFPYDGHKIGGYAYFTQSDPREEKTEYSDWVLLLQIDSQDDVVVWGDMGVGNFFIHPDALKRKDFSNVLYNWDCT